MSSWRWPPRGRVTDTARPNRTGRVRCGDRAGERCDWLSPPAIGPTLQGSRTRRPVGASPRFVLRTPVRGACLPRPTASCQELHRSALFCRAGRSGTLVHGRSQTERKPRARRLCSGRSGRREAMVPRHERCAALWRDGVSPERPPRLVGSGTSASLHVLRT
jgi:hypothetical protein